MDTTLNVANAWQRLLRQSFLPASMPIEPERHRSQVQQSTAAPDRCFDSAETMPMLYRSEAFAEDLFESHPQLA